MYADLLINKVHMRPRPVRSDVQQQAITVIRARKPQEGGMADYRNLLAGGGERPR